MVFFVSIEVWIVLEKKLHAINCVTFGIRWWIFGVGHLVQLGCFVFCTVMRKYYHFLRATGHDDDSVHAELLMDFQIGEGIVWEWWGESANIFDIGEKLVFEFRSHQAILFDIEDKN